MLFLRFSIVDINSDVVSPPWSIAVSNSFVAFFIVFKEDLSSLLISPVW